MRRLWIVVIAIIILVPVALAIGLSLVPDSVYRDRITAAVKSATGRDLTIGGDIGVSFFPLGVSVKDVALSNAQGFSAPAFASMKSLDVGVAILPLLTGKVEIARFVLVEPKIALEIDESGKNNWTFESQKAAETPAATPEESQKKPGGALKELSLGDVKLEDGLVSYANHQTGETWEASAINIDVSLPSLDKEATLDGSAVWKGKKVTVSLKADSPRAMQTSTGSKLSLKVESELLTASFDGNAAGGDSAKLTGATDLKITSVRELSAWLAKPMTPGRGFGPLAIKGNLAAQSDQIDFTDATVNFDKIDGTGRVSVRTGGERPHVNAELDVGTLDTTPYLGGAAAGGGDGGAPGAPVSGNGDWSTEPIDLSALKAVDGDFRFKAKTILVNKLTFTNSVLNLTLKDGILFADLSKLELYGGTGKAKIVVGGADGSPQLSTDLAFSNIQIEPFLRDGANFDKLSGTGNLTLSVKSQGSSQKALASNMSGNGAMKLVNGAIKGINLAAMVRNVTGAFAGQIPGSEEQKTDFASLGGTWTIASGVLHNSDMELLNPLIRVQGSGTADIGNKTVNYVIVPKAVASIEGQGGKTDLTGVSVPVRVTGPWSHLTFAPDPKGLLEGALKGMTDAQNAGQDPLKGALKGLIGQPGAKTDQQQPPAGSQQPPPKKEKPAEKLLKGILGGQ